MSWERLAGLGCRAPFGSPGASGAQDLPGRRRALQVHQCLHVTQQGCSRGCCPAHAHVWVDLSPARHQGLAWRMGEGLCSHRPVLGALCPHLLLNGRTVRKLRLRGVCGLRLGWELQGHGVWPGLEKTDEAPPEPNPGHEAHCACACRFPGGRGRPAPRASGQGFPRALQSPRNEVAA